jgi:sulfofructosephosphate aldolase
VPSTDPFDPSAIAAADGTFRMLAIDQRESLRTLLVSAGQPSADSDLTAFKVAVARTLSPAATGMLIDRDYGLDAVVAAGALGEGCGLIVAVDRLIQKPGAALTWSELDHAAMTPALRAAGAVACKFLVVWRPDDPVGPRQAMVRTFIDGCRTLGLVSVLEGLIQVSGVADGPTVDAAILAAAREFGPCQPDVYKTHVPTHGLGSAAEIEARSAELTAAIGCPWVVLSAGVPVERFADAVGAAGAGGASGFLAGRGVWGPSILAADPTLDLATTARERLEQLAAIAAASARPWWEAEPTRP